MARLLLLSESLQDSMPSLGLLGHHVSSLPDRAESILRSPPVDITLIDARHDLAHARALCQLVKSSALSPILVVISESGLATMNETWHADDFVLVSATAGELDARIRLRLYFVADEAPAGEIRVGQLAIDESTYTAKISGRLLNLTYKEFQLLNFLALYPGEVFSRDRMLHEVWGYDYFGGTRTVDVHIRRLRAKLGPGYESLIGTVRNVGYRLEIVGEGGETAASSN